MLKNRCKGSDFFLIIPYLCGVFANFAKNMKKGFAIAAMAAGLLVSCKDSKMTNVFDTDEEAEGDSVEAFVGDTLHLFEEETEPPVTIDELFNDFLYEFLSDARFQHQRIVFPLPYHSENEDERWSKREWDEHNHLGGHEVYAVIYEREQDLELQKDTTVNSVAIERFVLGGTGVEKYNFNRVNGKWMLTDVKKKKLDEMPNGNFLHFYAQFMEDSVFQREALASSVKVVLTSEDGEEEPQVEEIDADEWFEMKHDLPLPQHALVNINYGQGCISQNRKTLLLQGVSNGMQMEFKFNKQGEMWKLTEVVY